MKRQAYAKRRDANEPEIVKALRDVGATVELLDWCDLLVGYKGVNYLIEVKTEKGTLTDNQELDFPRWNGRKIKIERTVEAALKEIGVNV
jgi:hypothetical protein